MNIHKFIVLFLCIFTVVANGAGKRILVSQKCAAAVKAINQDAVHLIRYMNSCFDQTRKHGWTQKPSDVIERHGAEWSRTNGELQSQHMPATQYIAKFIKPIAEKLDKDFEDKKAELNNDKEQAWKWFQEHFTQRTSKVLAPYKRALVDADQRELAEQDRQNREKKE